MSSVSNTFMEKHLSKLVGRKVTGILVDNHEDTVADFGEPLYGLEFSGGVTAVIMRDPEGNGPGWLDIMEGE